MLRPHGNWIAPPAIRMPNSLGCKFFTMWMLRKDPNLRGVPTPGIGWHAARRYLHVPNDWPYFIGVGGTQTYTRHGFNLTWDPVVRYTVNIWEKSVCGVAILLACVRGFAPSSARSDIALLVVAAGRINWSVVVGYARDSFQLRGPFRLPFAGQESVQTGWRAFKAEDARL